MRVLVVDPGPHVGVATFDSDVAVGQSGAPRFFAHEYDPWFLYHEAEGWIRWADVVVVEGFRIAGPRATSANETIEMIGVLRFLAEKLNTPFVEQTPTDAMTFVSPAKLKRLGWWTTGSDHARSASRHLVLYLSRAGVLDPTLLLPSPSEGGPA